MKTKDTDCKACNSSVNPDVLASEDISRFASSGDMTGALTASFGLALDGKTASKVGSRLGSKSPSTLMKFLDVPGSNKQKKNMNDSQKKNHIINSVGLGNFSLNSTFEDGLINNIADSRGSSSDFLKNSDIGSSLIGASALGIATADNDMLGIGENDSSMFKIFKLAAFGMKMLCASLKDKQKGGPGGYTSDTEEALGLILALGIDLSLLARLKSIFDKLMALKNNFSAFGIQDLNLSESLFNLCDWVENMEYGSDTLDTLRKNLPMGLSNKKLTELAGQKLINEGTYDTYARNDFGFDQQFKSIAGDVDALKCDACRLGNTQLSIQNNGTSLFNLEFDPRTGLNRETNWSEVNEVVNKPNVLNSGIDFQSTNEQISFDEDSEGDIVVFSDNNKPKTVDALTKPALAGDDTLHVNNPTQFPIDSWVEVGEGTENAECVACRAYGSLKLKTPLKNSHEAGTGISAPSAESPCLLREKNKIKKNTIISDTEYSQKSIESQLKDKTKNTTKHQDKKTKDERKSVNEYLGLPEEDRDDKKDERENLDRSHVTTEVDEPDEGIKYNSDSDSIIYDTYKDDNENLVRDTYTKNKETNRMTIKKREIKVTKPYGGEPAAADATEVKSYFTGETIKKEDLKGTILEDADLNAVALLHPNDLKNLKNKEAVNKTISDAKKVFDEKFNTEIEKTENLVLEQQSDGIIFGMQLPKVLNGNQIVINSERVLISAKTQEVGIFAKRKFFVTTDDEITMNCKQRFVVKTDMHASIEAPTVHLGTYTTKNHPSLKGDCTVWWLQELCDWLSRHTHNDPYVTTSTPVQQGWLASLRARAPTLLSERIFISG